MPRDGRLFDRSNPRVGWAKAPDAAGTDKPATVAPCPRVGGQRKVARVDATRLKTVAQLYGKLGLAAADAEARAVLLYSFIFGQSLLFLEQAPRKRASLIAACAEALTED